MSRGESRDGTSVNPSGILMFSMLVGGMKYKCNQIFWHFNELTFIDIKQKISCPYFK